MRFRTHSVGHRLNTLFIEYRIAMAQAYTDVGKISIGRYHRTRFYIVMPFAKLGID